MRNLELSLSPHLFQQYVKARCPIAKLPPLYALELLTIYAWEVGTKAHERFHLDRGLVTVMCLLQEYQSLCIYWTNYYKFQNPIIEDFVREQLKKERYWIMACQSQIKEERKRKEGKEVLSFGEGAVGGDVIKEES